MSRWFKAFMCIIIVCLSAAAAASTDDDSREYQVKAAMVFNFAQFVEWPTDAFSSPSAPLVIGVVGANPFGSTLEQLVAGKSIGGHGLTVKYFASPEEIENCQVLFVPKSQEPRLEAIIKKVSGKPVLTIGESDSFPWAGGIIRFYTEDNKVRFEINADAAEQCHVTISSKLLKLARIFKK